MSLRTTSPLWAKLTLKRLRALPELGQETSILHSTVGSAMLKAWSVTYADKPDASAWAYCDVHSGEKEPTRVAPGWLEKIIRNLGASDHDSDVDAVFRAIQKNVVYNRRMPTTAVVAEWTLSIATVEDTMPEGFSRRQILGRCRRPIWRLGRYRRTYGPMSRRTGRSTNLPNESLPRGR